MNTELNTGVIKVFELEYPGYKSIRARILVPAQTQLFVNTIRHEYTARRSRNVCGRCSQISLSQGQRVSNWSDKSLPPCHRLSFSLSQSFSQSPLMHFSQMVPVSSSISFDQAKIIFMHLGLTSLAELEKVAFEDSLDTWLKDRVVDTNRRPDSLTAGSILPLSSESFGPKLPAREKSCSLFPSGGRCEAVCLKTM